MTLNLVRGLPCIGRNRRLSSWTQPIPRDVPVDIHPEVKDALADHKPVVALETALVTHGLPYPANVDVPLALEEVVRSTGSIPATIGVIQGRVKIGLERHELERLAEGKTKSFKISRRDVAAAIATKSDGGTTCSATLLFAAFAGIKVFATGGYDDLLQRDPTGLFIFLPNPDLEEFIVEEKTASSRSLIVQTYLTSLPSALDISADLHELTRCPVGLVSSGVKSILDIKRTLEYLETLGVPAISYGDSKEFPAFYTRRSGYTVPWNVSSPLTAARVLYTQQQLGMQNGALIAVPIPEEYEAVGLQIQKVVDQAVRESEENGISGSGNDATPWLLGRIAELTGGKSLTSNAALLKNAALVAGKIAREYQKLVTQEFCPPAEENVSKTWASPKVGIAQDSITLDKKAIESHPSSSNVVIIGSAAVDITAHESPGINADLARHSTVPGHVRISSGGVGRNIAEATHRIFHAKFSSANLSSVLLAPIGNDAFGEIISKELGDTGMRTDGLMKCEGEDSAVCSMVLDGQGALVGGVADMDIIGKLTADTIIPHLERLAPNLVALDGNLSSSTLKALITYCNDRSIKALFEPTSVVKSVRILPAVASALEPKHARTPIAFCTPNLLELSQLYDAARSEQFGLMDHPVWWAVVDDLNLGSAFRLELEQLSRRPVSKNTDSGKTISFLLDQGFVQRAVHLLPFFQHLVIKCGDQGALVVMRIAPEDAANSGWRHERSNPLQRYVVATGKTGSLIVVQHFPAIPVPSVENVTGAGDSFVGALLATLAENPSTLYHPETLEKAMSIAQKAAAATLQCHSAVSPLLSELD